MASQILQFLITLDIGSAKDRKRLREVTSMMDAGFLCRLFDWTKYMPIEDHEDEMNRILSGMAKQAPDAEPKGDRHIITVFPDPKGDDPHGLRNWPIEVTLYRDGQATWRPGPDNVTAERVWAKLEKEAREEPEKTVSAEPMTDADLAARLARLEAERAPRATVAPPVQIEENPTLWLRADEEGIFKLSTLFGGSDLIFGAPGYGVNQLTGTLHIPRSDKDVTINVWAENLGGRAEARINVMRAKAAPETDADGADANGAAQSEPWQEPMPSVDPPRYMLGDTEPPMPEYAAAVEAINVATPEAHQARMEAMFAAVEPPVEDETISPMVEILAPAATEAPVQAEAPKVAPASADLDEAGRIEAWHLWFDLGLDADEIAAALGVRPMRVKSLISAITAKIRVIPGTKQHYDYEPRGQKKAEVNPKPIADPDTPDLDGWTLREDAELTRLKAMGKSDVAIATALKRKPPAIRHRLTLIEADLGTDIKGAADILAEDLRLALNPALSGSNSGQSA